MGTSAHGKSSSPTLVIFGCGYVGGALARSALADGWSVTGLTRNSATAATLRAQGVNGVVADLASEAWHRLVPASPDFVVNCVAGGGAGLAGYQHSYVDGMRSILKWIHATGPVGTLVYTSSTSVYPNGGGVRIDEQTPLQARDDRSRLLIEAEDVLRGGERAVRRTIVLRLAGIYGPGRHHLLAQVRSGVVAGDGEHRLNLIHRDDIVAAIRACFTATPDLRQAVFNVADDHPTPKREVVEWLARRIGVPLPRFTGVPAEGRRAVPPDRIIVNELIKRTLGWQPVYPSFREGYAAILAEMP